MQQWQPHSDKTTPSPRARGRWQRIQNPVLSEVLAREAVGNAYSTLRFWKSSCARPLAANTAPCAFGSPRARGRRQRRQHLAHSQALVREAVGSGYSTLRSSKSSCARPLATNTAACAFASPRARGRLKWIQQPALSQVLVREAVGDGCSILRFRKSSCARPLATDTASCAFASPFARGRWQRILHPALSQVLVRASVGNGCSILRFLKSLCARPLATDTASCAFASPCSRGRWQRIQHPALSQVSLREAVGKGYSILRPFTAPFSSLPIYLHFCIFPRSLLRSSRLR